MRTPLIIFLALVANFELSAAIIINGSTADWTAVLPSNPTRQSDYFGDPQAMAADVDIVGTTDDPGFFVQFWDGGDDTSHTDGQLAFRLRISGESNPAGYSNFAFIGMDLTGDGAIDIFAEVGAAAIEIRDAGSNLNDSPSTTSISSTSLFSYSTDVNNFSWEAVSTTNDPGVTSIDIDGTDGTDYFISFLIPYADLVSTANSLSVDTDYNDTKSIAYVAMTGTQNNALNSDFNALNKSETSSTSTWSALGAISPELNADGTVAVPEPSFYSLALSMAALLFCTKRRI